MMETMGTLGPLGLLETMRKTRTMLVREDVRRSAATRVMRLGVALLLGLVLARGEARAQPLTPREGAVTLLGSDFSNAEIDAVARVLAQQIATFPVGTSSGGFTFRIDPRTGVQALKARSFGPFFAERSTTLGSQGMLALSINSQSTRFIAFEGRNVRNGDLRSRVILPGGQVADVNRFTFNVTTQTTSVNLVYAADDNIDIGVIVPFVSTNLNGTATALDLRSLLVAPGLPQATQRVVDATGFGLGDMAVRGKWNVVDRPGGGLSALAEVFLPTGSTERLSGTGRVRVRPSLVASATAGGFSPHANIGYTFGGPGVEVQANPGYLPQITRGEIGDEFNYTLGADVTPAGPLTLYVDLIGRTMLKTARFAGGQGRLADYGSGGPLIQTIVPYVGSVNMRLGAVGARTTVLGNGLLSVGLLFPLTNEGLKPGLTPVIGYEYTFK